MKKIDLTITNIQIDELSFANDINKKIHEKHKNLPKDVEIPFLFIDPVVDIFKDPCNSGTTQVTTREKEQFQKYTDKYEFYLNLFAFEYPIYGLKC